MTAYKNILIAVDLDDANKQVVSKAIAIAGENATLNLIHVIEPIQIYGPIPTIDYASIQSHTNDFAKKKLSALGEEFSIDVKRQYVLEGVAQKVIHAFAEENGVDLIVVGSHGRHGVSLLLGSTANAVLHGAQSDVLAVRV
ncbi:MAG: universal stress protein [Pseudomonadales bacterium]|nr:universal stress protein [Pseudomonadales bacterium]